MAPDWCKRFSTPVAALMMVSRQWFAATRLSHRLALVNGAVHGMRMAGVYLRGGARVRFDRWSTLQILASMELLRVSLQALLSVKEEGWAELDFGVVWWAKAATRHSVLEEANRLFQSLKENNMLSREMALRLGSAAHEMARECNGGAELWPGDVLQSFA